MQKTTDSLENLENRLENWFTDVESKANGGRTETVPDNRFSNIINKLNSTENNLIEEIAKLKKDLHDNTANKEKDSVGLVEKTHTIFSEVMHCAI